MVSYSSSWTKVIVMEKLVVVVDGQKLLEEYIQAVLKSHGYTSASFTDPLKTLEFFRHRHDDADLVTTDITMPSIDGIELARQVIAIKRDIPIVFVSSDGAKLNEAKSISSTRACFMKPVDPTSLIKCVEGLIGPAQVS